MNQKLKEYLGTLTRAEVPEVEIERLRDAMASAAVEISSQRKRSRTCQTRETSCKPNGPFEESKGSDLTTGCSSPNASALGAEDSPASSPDQT